MTYISFVKAVEIVSQHTDRAFGSVHVSFQTMLTNKKAVNGTDYQMAVGYGQSNSRIYVVTRNIMADCINSMRGVTHEDMKVLHEKIFALPETSLEEEVVRLCQARGQRVPAALLVNAKRNAKQRLEALTPAPIKVQAPAPHEEPRRIIIEMIHTHNININVGGRIEIEGTDGFEPGGPASQALTDKIIAQVTESIDYSKVIDFERVAEQLQPVINRNTRELLEDKDSGLSQSILRSAVIRRANGA